MDAATRLFWLCLGLCLAVAPQLSLAEPHNLTAFLQHRQKRWLIFQNSGSMKFSIGPSLPVPLEDPVTWRSFVLSFSLQGGTYSLPTTPWWPWDKWEETFARSLHQMRQHIERPTANGSLQFADETRLFTYTALEQFMSRRSQEQPHAATLGRQCLLRSICENAQVQRHVGIFSEIINIVLTPGKAQLAPVYRDAYAAGKAGANCLRLFAACPRGSNIFDEYFILDGH